MNATRILHNASALPRALSGLVLKETAEAIQNKPRNLYETLARLPNDGVGARVFQTRWQSKGIEGCYYEVSRVRLKLEGTRGKAWGRLVWRGALPIFCFYIVRFVVDWYSLCPGKPVSEKEERISGSLKYMWSAGVSKGKNLRAVQEISSLPVARQLTAMQRASSPQVQPSAGA